MRRNENATVRKRAGVDILIIVAVTMVSLGVYSMLSSLFTQFVKNENEPVLLRLLSAALLQFGTAGLGMTVVCILRKESFSGFGLNGKNVLPAILFSCLMYLPHLILTAAYGDLQRYCPFQNVWTTGDLLSSNWPVAVAGMVITAVAWGFFEGFNYAVITDKINACLPSRHWLLDWGAIICAGMCVLIHGVIGVTPKDILEMLSVMIIIYGSLMVRKKTGNAWGLVFTFLFLWNAY